MSSVYPPPLSSSLLQRLEGAIARVGYVNSSWLACRNNLEHDRLQLDAALVPHYVHAAAIFNEPFPGLDDMRRAGGVVAAVQRRRARFDRHHTGPRVHMPAAVPARIEGVVQEIDIREALRLDLGSVGVSVGFDLDLIEERQREKGGVEPRAGRGQRSPGGTDEARDGADDEPCQQQDGQNGYSTISFPQLYLSHWFHLAFHTVRGFSARERSLG